MCLFLYLRSTVSVYSCVNAKLETLFNKKNITTIGISVSLVVDQITRPITIYTNIFLVFQNICRKTGLMEREKSLDTVPVEMVWIGTDVVLFADLF